VLVAEAFCALQLHYELLLYKQIGNVIANSPAFVENGKSGLRFDGNAAKFQLAKHRAFIEHFGEARAQDVRHLVNAADNPFYKMFILFIRVHPWPRE